MVEIITSVWLEAVLTHIFVLGHHRLSFALGNLWASQDKTFYMKWGRGGGT